MSASRALPLAPGRVYRTRDFAARTKNPTRLVSRLVREGRLRKLQGGLYYAPASSRWGELPPDPAGLLTTWLQGREGRDWIFTGSEAWNALGLGSTAVHPARWVYNRRRSGEFTLGGHRFLLRKVPFPPSPSPEWFVVDLLDHAKEAAVDREEVLRRLAEAVAAGRFDRGRLQAMAQEFGRKATREGIERAIAAATS